VERSKLPVEEVQKIVNDPEIRFTVSPERSFVYASELHRLGVLKHAASKWTDYFFPEAWAEPGS
jgi:NitT/TauT family transport system substrate-binding protein